MAKNFKTDTSAVGIAHYILLFLVVVGCISLVAWTLIKNNNLNSSGNTTSVIHVKNSYPCVQRARSTVAHMWEYDPNAVPQKYWDIAENYMNQVIPAQTYGICQDVAFVCNVGEIRQDCDPCAVPNARKLAQGIHVADIVKEYCQ